MNYLGKGRALGGGMNRLADALMGGWQIGGITTLQSGFPVHALLRQRANPERRR